MTFHIQGTVPFKGTFEKPIEYSTEYDKSATAPASNFVGGTNYPPPASSMLGYPDMPAPSYSAVVGDEAVNIAGRNDKDTFGDLNYAPVYTFAQPYAGSYQPTAEATETTPLVQ